METRSAKRKKIAEIIENEAKASTADRISDLPDDVLHHILFLLPIKCVAQMSILSKRWKFLWITLPDLDFTTLNPFALTSKNLKLDKYCHPLASPRMDYITQVLSIRDKHADIRILCFRARLSFSRLNSLTRIAIRQNVKELHIEVNADVGTDDFFNFPRCVIGSESLRVLNLKSGFRLPPSSILKDGFRYLHTLSLSLVILYHQPSLSDLFCESSFPLLRNLHLELCMGLTYLHVGCRGLQNLSLERCYQLQALDISCSKLERMRVVSCLDPYKSDKTWEDKINTTKLQSASNFLSGLSHAHSLTLQRQTIEILSRNNFFFQPFDNLKSLELHTGFNKSNVQGLACLFRSSPTLHTLVLIIINDFKTERKEWNRDLWDMTSTEEEQYWESQIPSIKSFLQHLKVAKIQGFLDCENEVTLAKFLLRHGKALEEMILCTGHCNTRDTLRRQKIRSQMMGFSWASSNAKVEFQ